MNFWQGKRVLVTGHTGFKGAWFVLWLVSRGARVTGVALPPDTSPALFDQLGIADDVDHRIVDIRNQEALQAVVAQSRPDVVFHLAAQSIVRRGYRLPVETWATNVMGTVHVLELLRTLDKPVAAVLVTTDKVYENREWEFGYRETDTLGGRDPYSASKAGCEIAISSWRRSFFQRQSPVRIASVRAGNVIGGGDWCEDRIVPDLVRALGRGKAIKVRNPNATRPWQHVLDPLAGYLLLARRLLESFETPPAVPLAGEFNFGPDADSQKTVRQLVEESLRHWPGSWEDASHSDQPHETSHLALCIDRAREQLGWTPRWNFERSVRQTISWYRSALEAIPCEIRNLSLKTIADFEATPGCGAIP